MNNGGRLNVSPARPFTKLIRYAFRESLSAIVTTRSNNRAE